MNVSIFTELVLLVRHLAHIGGNALVDGSSGFSITLYGFPMQVGYTLTITCGCNVGTSFFWWLHSWLYCVASSIYQSVGKNTELDVSIHWIGWSFHFSAGYINIPKEKRDKLIHYIHQLVRHSRTPRAYLEKVIGLIMWITQLFPFMRIWVRHLYNDLYSIPCTNSSIDPGSCNSSDNLPLQPFPLALHWCQFDIKM